MTGNPDVISGILASLAGFNVAFEKLHNQEHLWESEGFGKLETWWDEANRDLWKLHHKLLVRLYKLGGKPEGVTTDPVAAFTTALTLFQGLHEQCQTIYAAAEADNDYVTTLKLSKIQAELEAWIVSTEKKLKQLKMLDPVAKPTPFMTEQL